MNTDMGIPALAPYLKQLDEEQLNRILDEVLTECRRREADKIKQDILSHSQAIRLNRRPTS
jgi:hypothetical protein